MGGLGRADGPYFWIQYLQMWGVICVVFALIRTEQAVYRQITNGVTFNSDDSLISPLGYFKATLLSNGCRLVISQFRFPTSQQPGYTPLGNLTSPKSNNSSCQSLSLTSPNPNSPPRLATNQNQTFIQLASNCPHQKFTIDDEGILRLSCILDDFTEDKRNQYLITTFNFAKSHMKSVVNARADKDSSLEERKTKGEWVLMAQNGTLLIYNYVNKSQNITYHYGGFTITTKDFVDGRLRRPRSKEFDNFDYVPRCGSLKQPPFAMPLTFVMNEYWPLFEVYDQTGYPLLSLQYPLLDCVKDVGAMDMESRHCVSWICPPELFLFNDTCVRTCPWPLYHSIREKGRGRCVIACHEGGLVYQNWGKKIRVCSCQTYQEKYDCPQNSISTVASCSCENNKNLYYDGIRCAQTCPTGYYPNNGICLTCPFFCEKCQLSKNHIAFLKCTTCEKGYHISNNACVKKCNNLIGKSPYSDGKDQKCQSCKNPYCINCYISPTSCVSCNPVTANAEDSFSCNSTSRLNPATCNLSTTVFGFFSKPSFACMLRTSSSMCTSLTSHYYGSQAFLMCMNCRQGYISAETCVSDCSKKVGRDVEPDKVNRVCKCRSNGIMISQMCYNITTCPLRMCLNTTLRACVSCHFGCATCECTQYGIICTSCFPDYVFLTQPEPKCIMDSSLVACGDRTVFQPDEYLCLPSDSNFDQRQPCLRNVSNCRVCVNLWCLVCRKGFYLFQGQCLMNCPNDMFIYRGVCILNSISDTNCTNFTVASVYNFAAIDDTIVKSQAYKFYTQYGHRQLSLKTRGTIHISQAVYKCLKCRQGYGVSDKGLCQQCVFPCVTCIRKQNNSCLSCPPLAYVLEGRTCKQLYPLCVGRQFRNLKNQCVDTCNTFYINLTDRKVNCSEDCPKDWTPIREDNKTYLTCVRDGRNDNYTKVFASVFRDHRGLLTMFMVPLYKLDSEDYEKSKNYSPIIDIYRPSQQKSRLLSQQNSTTFVTREYLYLSTSQHYPSHSTIRVNFTPLLRAYRSTKNTFLTNSVYGVRHTKSYANDIYKRLFFFGAVLSCVLIMLEVVYIGNCLLYRVDNTMILAQTVYYFLFHRFRPHKTLGQFYNGFKYAHCGFFINYFKFMVPHQYLENAPLPYRLVNHDANYFRNAGDSLSTLLTFLPILCLLYLILWLSKKYCRRTFLHTHPLSTQPFYALIQLVLMNLFYFSITQLKYGHIEVIPDSNFHRASMALAITTLCVALVYTVLRMVLCPVGGLYCVKRLVVASVMATTYHNNVSKSLFAIEPTFMILRILLEKPYKMRDFITMYIEEALIVAVYAVLIFDNSPNATVLLTTIVLLIFTTMLGFGLGEILLDQLERTERQIKKGISQVNIQRNSQSNEAECLLRSGGPTQMQPHPVEQQAQMATLKVPQPVTHNQADMQSPRPLQNSQS